jgi:hypothetical protein
MQNAELIKALKEDAEWAHANEWETPITLGDHLDAAAAALEAADKREEAQRWIPVNERLPEPNTETLVLTDAGSIRQGYIGHATGRWCSGGFVMVPTVTHWQPLPQPPQKGE